MKYAFLREKQVAFPVTMLCRGLGVSRSDFYGFVAEPETQRERRDGFLAAKVWTVFEMWRPVAPSYLIIEERRSEAFTEGAQ